MRSILAFVVAAFVTILLAGAPAATKDLCNGGQPACQLQADTPFKMAAEMPTPPKASRPAGAAKMSSVCSGKTGVALQRCKCEAKGESGKPCHFIPAHPPVGASCACR
jgi:hypothetical protein